MEFVCDKAAEAVNEALDHLEPCRLKIATGEAKGKIAYNYYAPQLYDRRMSVIQAQSRRRQERRHARQLRDSSRSAGQRGRLLQPRSGRPAVRQARSGRRRHGHFHERRTRRNDHGRQPAARPAAQPDGGEWKDSRTWDECLRIGHLMADEAERIVKDAPVQENPQLVCDSMNVEFPIENPLMWAITVGSPLKYPHNDANHSVTCRLNLINLGNAQIVTIPGRGVAEHRLLSQAENAAASNNLLFGLTNDAFGYILTKVDFHSFPRYDYVSRTSLGEMTGEILIDNSSSWSTRTVAPEHLATK